jgi:hypothetical protein
MTASFQETSATHQHGEPPGKSRVNRLGSSPILSCNTRRRKV